MERMCIGADIDLFPAILFNGQCFLFITRSVPLQLYRFVACAVWSDHITFARVYLYSVCVCVCLLRIPSGMCCMRWHTMCICEFSSDKTLRLASQIGFFSLFSEKSVRRERRRKRSSIEFAHIVYFEQFLWQSEYYWICNDLLRTECVCRKLLAKLKNERKTIECAPRQEWRRRMRTKVADCYPPKVCVCLK